MRMRIMNLPEPNNESESESKIIRVRIRYLANARFPTKRIPHAGVARQEANFRLRDITRLN
jgi:hypothetical protein